MFIVSKFKFFICVFLINYFFLVLFLDYVAYIYLDLLVDADSGGKTTC